MQASTAAPVRDDANFRAGHQRWRFSAVLKRGERENRIMDILARDGVIARADITIDSKEFDRFKKENIMRRIRIHGLGNVYRYYDLFKQGRGPAATFYFKEFNDKVAHYFADMIKDPVDLNKYKCLVHAFRNGGFTMDEARQIAGLKYHARYLRKYNI